MQGSMIILRQWGEAGGIGAMKDDGYENSYTAFQHREEGTCVLGSFGITVGGVGIYGQKVLLN